nr:unnamed protein product [Haemonchus contortus]
MRSNRGSKVDTTGSPRDRIGTVTIVQPESRQPATYSVDGRSNQGSGIGWAKAQLPTLIITSESSSADIYKTLHGVLPNILP